MSISYYQLVITGYARALNNLAHIIDKAIAHCQKNMIDENALLVDRLYPDMFPLAKQLQMCCFMTASAASWLTGKAPMEFANTEKTFADYKALIGKTVAYLNTYKEADFDKSADILIRMPWKPEPALRGDVFLPQHSIPNVYFHVTTAYNILRHNGVVIGKNDYLGEIK